MESLQKYQKNQLSILIIKLDIHLILIFQAWIPSVNNMADDKHCVIFSLPQASAMIGPRKQRNQVGELTREQKKWRYRREARLIRSLQKDHALVGS